MASVTIRTNWFNLASMVPQIKQHTSKIGYYVIKFVSESYTLQYDTTCNGIIVSAGELVVKAQYLSCIQEKNDCYWDKKNNQQVIIVPTKTIVHPCIDVVAVKDVQDIPKIICNINHLHPIYLNESDHDYILKEIEHIYKIDLEINIRDDGDEE